MAYYYIKSGFGTRTTGGGTTKQTGSFASLGAANVYDNILDAETDGAAPGDLFLCSDLHNYDHPSSYLSYLTIGQQVGTVWLSVDDANCDQEKAGAREDCVGSTTYVRAVAYIRIDVAGNSGLSQSGSAQTLIDGRTYESQVGPLTCQSTAKGSIWGLKNSTLRLGDSADTAQVYGGSLIKWFGGTLDSVSSAYMNFFIGGANFATSGGATVEVRGVDLSIIKDTGGEGYLVDDVTSDILAKDNTYIDFYDCKIDSTASLFKGTVKKLGSYVASYNTTSDSDEAEYQFEIHKLGGKVESDIAIWRQESSAFPGGKRVTAKITTNSDASTTYPFWFEIPIRQGKISDPAQDTLRIYFATLTSTADLTDQNIWADAIYSDGATKEVGNYISNRNSDILATGTACTIDSASDWQSGTQGSGTGLTTYDEHYMDLDTSSDEGADGIVILRIFVGEPSIVVHVDTTVEYVA